MMDDIVRHPPIPGAVVYVRPTIGMPLGITVEIDTVSTEGVTLRALLWPDNQVLAEGLTYDALFSNPDWFVWDVRDTKDQMEHAPVDSVDGTKSMFDRLRLLKLEERKIAEEDGNLRLSAGTFEPRARLAEKRRQIRVLTMMIQSAMRAQTGLWLENMQPLVCPYGA